MKIKTFESPNTLLFDWQELDQIVDAAMADRYPLISAKRWAVTDK